MRPKILEHTASGLRKWLERSARTNTPSGRLSDAAQHRLEVYSKLELEQAPSEEAMPPTMHAKLQCVWLMNDEFLTRYHRISRAYAENGGRYCKTEDQLTDRVKRAYTNCRADTWKALEGEILSVFVSDLIAAACASNPQAKSEAEHYAAEHGERALAQTIIRGTLLQCEATRSLHQLQEEVSAIWEAITMPRIAGGVSVAEEFGPTVPYVYGIIGAHLDRIDRTYPAVIYGSTLSDFIQNEEAFIGQSGDHAEGETTVSAIGVKHCGMVNSNFSKKTLHH